MPPTEGVQEYGRRVHDAFTRNATLERLAQSGAIPLDTMAVFADFLSMYPSVPLKTRTDLGTHYHTFDYPHIMAGFFNKIALDIQTTGQLPQVAAADLSKLDLLLKHDPTGHFTEDEYRQLQKSKVNPNIVANIICARNLASYAHEKGYRPPAHPPVPEARDAFSQDWEEAMSMISTIQTIGEEKAGITPDAASVRPIITFAQWIRSYPFIPLKITSQTGSDYVPFDFNEMVHQYFQKLSQHVINGTPVNALGKAEADSGRLVLQNKALTVELLATSETTVIHKVDEYNGLISPFTVPNLVIAERLLNRFMPYLQE